MDFLQGLLGGIGGAAKGVGDYQTAKMNNDLAIKKQKSDFNNELTKAILVEMMKGRVKQGMTGFGDTLGNNDLELIQHDPTAYMMKMLKSGKIGTGGPVKPAVPRPPLFNTPAVTPAPATTGGGNNVIDLNKFMRQPAVTR